MSEQAAELRALAERRGGGVVRIGRGWGRGAGFVLADGAVATNAHNIRGEAVTVTFGDGRSATGRLAGVDVDGDLAVVEVDTGEAAPLPWAAGAADEVGPGDVVVTLTHDAAAGRRVTTGRISARGAAFRSPRGRLVTEALEHTAPLARGSSGGPLLDAEGHVVGINTHRRGDGFYLAIPADAALRERLDRLRTGTPANRARLGVAVAPPHVAARMRDAVGLPEREGLLVRGVEEDGPADRAGLRKGDLLVAAGGRPLRSSDDLFAILDGVEPGGELVLAVVRGAEDLTLTATFPDGA